jgi:hypothetical protein
MDGRQRKEDIMKRMPELRILSEDHHHGLVYARRFAREEITWNLLQPKEASFLARIHESGELRRDIGMKAVAVGSENSSTKLL